jgi:hypothetical protein
MASNHNGMAMAKEGWERDMYHEASPPHDMKMPKIEPILQLLKPNHICRSIKIPPTSYISQIYHATI